MKPAHSKAWLFVAALPAAVACGPSPAALMEELAEAVGPRRVVYPRLSGPFSYAPCPLSQREDDLVADLACRTAAPSDPSYLARLSDVGRKIADLADRDGSAASLQVQAAWQLMWPAEPRSLDSAVSLLRAAKQLDSTDADILTDLGAALLLRAGRAAAPVDLMAALGNTRRAVRHGGSAAARFDHAVALEQLSFFAQADSAWRGLLEVDSGSGWSDEARDRIEYLRRASAVSSSESVRPQLEHALAAGSGGPLRELAGRRPRAIREYLGRTVLTTWADAVVAEGSAPAAELLRPARMLAEAIAGASGDHLWADGVARLEATPDARSAARGYLALESGRQAAEAGRHADALERFAEAERRLRRGGNPLAEWAAYHGGVAHYYQTLLRAGELEDVLAGFARTRDRIASRRYPVLTGLTHYMQALVHAFRGDHATARDRYRRARNALVGADPDYAAAAMVGEAFVLDRLGARDEAWAVRYRALRLAPALERPSARYQVLAGSALAAQGAGLAEAALVLHDVNVAAASADSTLWRVALGSRVDFLIRTGDTAAARTDLRTVLALARAEGHRMARADALLTAGRLNRHAAPDLAVRQLTEALAVYDSTSQFGKVVRTRLAAADAELARGSIEDAAVHFDGVLAELQRQERLVALSDRMGFFDEARSVFDRITAFKASTQSADATFEFVESSRARVLLRALADSVSGLSPSHTAADIKASLPGDVAVVSYTLLPASVLVTVTDRNDVHLVTLAEGGAAQDRLRRGVESIAGGDADDFLSVMTSLHRRLFSPVARFVAGKRRLVFVPDGWMHFIPFAALHDPADDAFLVQRHEITVAPSASWYLQARRRGRLLGAPPSVTALAVGDPAFDAAAFDHRRLPHARREARDVAATYGPGALSLLGDRASRAAFEREAPRHDVIHIASHAVMDALDPADSYLLLAPSGAGADTGVLRLGAIARLRLDRTKLVVLSACHTGSGELSATEGPSSFARAFLAAGVPAVIATLWAVEDDAASDFSVELHRYLAAGLGPTAALRRTQTGYIRKHGVDAFSVWAAFQTVGALTD